MAGLRRRAPENFGDEITVDHMVADNAQSEGVGGKRYALAMLDRATGWLGFRALKSKSSHEAETALREFIGPRNRVESVYSDNSPEPKSLEELKTVVSDFVECLDEDIVRRTGRDIWPRAELCIKMSLSSRNTKEEPLRSEII